MVEFSLKLNPNQLEEVRRSYSYDDAKLKSDLDHFDRWIRKQNHFRVRDFDRNYLERYLIYNKGSIERAKKRFDRMCTFRNLMPEFLQNFDIMNEFGPIFNCCHVASMPIPTPDNYRIFIIKVFGNDDRVQLINFYRYIVVLTEFVLYHDYCLGYELIIDIREMPFSLLSKINPVVINKAITLLMETMGQRVKNLHFLSGSKYFQTFMTIVKSILSEKLMNRIIIHDSNKSLSKYISKDKLPEDYGGNETSIKEHSESMFKAISSDEHVARIKFLETASTDESCRLSVRFNEEYSGMPGSFKKLCVD